MKSKNESVAETPSRARVHAPRLRFPEFRNAGEWEECALGELAVLKNGYAFKSETYIEHGKYKIITIANVQNGEMKEEGMKEINTLPPDIQDHQLVCPGDILISMTGNVGRICKAKNNNCLLNQRVGKIVPKSISTEFLFQELRCMRFLSSMQGKAKGAAQGNICSSDILNFIILYPKPLEQQKIAACLSSLDSLIAAHGKKLEALKAWKKGLLQRLFPAEDEKVPRLRFPGFKGEWEEHRIGEDFEFGKSANNSRADLSDTGDVFYVHYGDIHTKFNTRIDFKKDTLPRISSSLNKNVTLLKNGDLILADASEDTEGIGKAVEVFGLEDGVKAIAGLHTIVLRDTKKKYVDGFRGILRDISTVRKQFDRLAVGVKVYSVSKSILEGIMVPLPYYTEQRKIASALSSLDSLIAAQARKIEELKDHKRGLMQGLFPETDNEVHTS